MTNKKDTYEPSKIDNLYKKLLFSINNDTYSYAEVFTALSKVLYAVAANKVHLKKFISLDEAIQFKKNNEAEIGYAIIAQSLMMLGWIRNLYYTQHKKPEIK